MAGDEESGDHEKDIDSDESARHDGEPRVIEHYRAHRNGAETLDVWSKSWFVGPASAVRR